MAPKSQVAIATVLLSTCVAANTLPAHAADFTFKYRGQLESLALQVSNLQPSTIAVNTTTDPSLHSVAGLLSFSNESAANLANHANSEGMGNSIRPEVELDSLFDLATQSFGGDFRSTYTNIVGSTTIVTPEGEAKLRFSEAGIEFDEVNAIQIAACEEQACQLTDTSFTVQAGNISYTGRYGDLVLEWANPKTVNDPTAVLGLFAIAGLTARYRRFQA